MLVAERHIIKKGHRFWAEIDNLSWQSKNLYNSANYLIRQNFIYGHGYLTYNQMPSLRSDTEQYQALPAKISQQVLRGLDRNWKSFFAASSEFKSHPDKFLVKPKIPGYKEPKKGRNLLVYTIQAISKVGLKQGLVKLSGTSIALPTRGLERLAEVRIVPKCDCYVIEVIYEKTEQFLAPNEKIAAIDLGIDNLMAVTSNQPDFIPLLINGRPLKSLNQFYNQRRAKLQSLLKGNRQSSQRIRRLTRCRNQKIDDYLHKASRYLVKLLVDQQITTLVIGNNPGWKQGVNLGKVNNQKFVTIPHARLIDMISYKCQLVGIKVIIQEESYTSVANFLNDDPLPVYGQTTEKPVFSGKRISRGLYRTDRGFLCQSDVMGSYNILRKAFPNAFNRYGIERCVVHPRRINLSK
ncbi:RNA-guided endonuclease InsQ/TnpB family protein [Microcystis aeruginosa]|uniref:IS200/IS605 family element transposase accessory protein TnpB n=1 Tax=Microcystis aeruginosa FD4 TaxID=2686288 RepID=A0A857DBJ9_MICAE|nr:RNA-guided endonuclease TnpB family protein [Microcystis aeruginosa]QGZ92903.1 IS200/IS605 family element transposase accessory protein TnpB [Microcystis aeruginosa FD4]